MYVPSIWITYIILVCTIIIVICYNCCICLKVAIIVSSRSNTRSGFKNANIAYRRHVWKSDNIPYTKINRNRTKEKKNKTKKRCKFVMKNMKQFYSRYLLPSTYYVRTYTYRNFLNFLRTQRWRRRRQFTYHHGQSALITD